MVRPWRSHRGRQVTGAPSAAGRRPSGPGGAASARPGARARRPGRPGRARAGTGPVPSRRAEPVAPPAVPIGQVDATDARARPTGLDELDRVLGGGLGPGAVVLLAGARGGGEATLLREAGRRG